MAFDWTFGYAGFLGVVAAISAVFFIGWILAKAKIKIPIVGNLLGSIPAKWMMFGALGFVLLVGLPLAGLQLIPKQGFSTGGSLGLDASDTSSTASAGGCNRPTGGNTASLLAAIENKDNPADAYISGPLSVVKADGTIDQTGNTVASTTLSFVTLAVTPCESGTLYATGNGTFASVKTSYSSNEPQASITLDSSLNTRMNIEPLNFNTGATLLANGSIPDSGVCPLGANNDRCGAPMSLNGAAANTSVIMTNQTLGSGGSVNFKYTLAAVTANSRYGAYSESESTGEGVVYSVYLTDLTAMSSSKGLTLGGLDGGVNLREITCPSDVSANRRANKCWVSQTLKSGFTYTGTGTFNCDLGDCAPQDYADFCVDDLQWVKDTDGKFKKVAFLLDGTNAGAGGTCMRAFFN